MITKNFRGRGGRGRVDRAVHSEPPIKTRAWIKAVSKSVNHGDRPGHSACAIRIRTDFANQGIEEQIEFHWH
jgi:hypothetical protein